MTAPDFLDQLLVGDDQSDMRGQRMKERVLFASQLDAVPLRGHHPRHQIDRKRAGSHYGVAVGAAQMPPQRGLASRQQLRNSERLTT